jgi:predicted AAA+ superfamily ATPase
MPRPVRYIADVKVSHAVEAKIQSKHNVTIDEVREAVVLCEVIRSYIEYHPEKGERLLVTGRTAERRVLNVVLYPAEPGSDGMWWLGTAMPA